MRRVLVSLIVIGLAAPALAGSALDDAREAFIKGDYQKAIALAQPQVASEPQQAWRLIGASSCFLKDKPRAKEAFAKLEPKGQSFLKYVCSRNNVTLP